MKLSLNTPAQREKRESVCVSLTKVCVSVRERESVSETERVCVTEFYNKYTKHTTIDLGATNRSQEQSAIYCSKYQ
jgi:hypothetical protein